MLRYTKRSSVLTAARSSVALYSRGICNGAVAALASNGPGGVHVQTYAAKLPATCTFLSLTSAMARCVMASGCAGAKRGRSQDPANGAIAGKQAVRTGGLGRLVKGKRVLPDSRACRGVQPPVECGVHAGSITYSGERHQAAIHGTSGDRSETSSTCSAARCCEKPPSAGPGQVAGPSLAAQHPLQPTITPGISRRR